jgi:hypothetical protein
MQLMGDWLLASPSDSCLPVQKSALSLAPGKRTWTLFLRSRARSLLARESLPPESRASRYPEGNHTRPYKILRPKRNKVPYFFGEATRERILCYRLNRCYRATVPSGPLQHKQMDGMKAATYPYHFTHNPLHTS